MVSWDTFGLFEELLADFGVVVQSVKAASAPDRVATGIQSAQLGFARFLPISAWTRMHSAFVAERLRNDLSAEELSWYEEHAEVIGWFFCFVLGALIARFTVDEIDEAGFLLGDAHLTGFVAMESERICAAALNVS